MGSPHMKRVSAQGDGDNGSFWTKPCLVGGMQSGTVCGGGNYWDKSE